MRVLLLTGHPHPFSDALYQRLAQEPDFDITQVAPADDNAPRKASTVDLSRNIHRLPATLGSLGRSGDPHRVYIRPLHLSLKQAQPDLVVCQFEQESVAAAQAALVCNLLRPTVPLTLYSWQNVLRHRSLAVRFVDLLTLRRADQITCANREAVDVLRQKGYRGSTDIAPLIGVDECHFRRLSDEEIQAMRATYCVEGFIIGFAGRLVPEKGVSTLIDAFARLDITATLIIIGSGLESDKLKHQVESLGITKRCRFIESVGYEQMPAHLNMLDVLVLPSRTTSNWKEQFGRVLVEAMACGVPVIGSDSGAIPEVIGDAGMIFPEGNAIVLAAQLRQLCENSEQKQQLALTGAHRALNTYTIEQIATQTAQTWRMVMSSHSAFANK